MASENVQNLETQQENAVEKLGPLAQLVRAPHS